LQTTDTSSRQRGHPTSTNRQVSDDGKNLVLGPRWGLTPRQTGRLTVGRIVTLTLTLTGGELLFVYDTTPSCARSRSGQNCGCLFHDSVPLMGRRRNVTSSMQMPKYAQGCFCLSFYNMRGPCDFLARYVHAVFIDVAAPNGMSSELERVH
jgi:hypothetical protein